MEKTCQLGAVGDWLAIVRKQPTDFADVKDADDLLDHGVDRGPMLGIWERYEQFLRKWW